MLAFWISGAYTYSVAVEKLQVTPEEWLKRAMDATTAPTRERFARQGLASRAPLDRTTQAMLLRQLYLASFELKRFEEAQRLASEAAELGVLTDVLHQDAARAAMADGDVDAAITHLRAAARSGPASRRPFHHWTLGSMLFLLKRYTEAETALARAVRWGTKDRPLYRAHLALVQIASGNPPADLQQIVTDLAEAPCGQGYGRFVLGHLAYAASSFAVARKHLQAFVNKVEAGPPVQVLALAGELSMARATLDKIRFDD